MFVATGAPDIFSQIQDHLDSAVRIFEPYELKVLSIDELRMLYLYLQKKKV